jgi:hypothetical protein
MQKVSFTWEGNRADQNKRNITENVVNNAFYRRIIQIMVGCWVAKIFYHVGEEYDIGTK